MEHRDLIKDQIEQLGKVLARILSDFFGLKSQGKTAQGLKIANESLRTELDLDIELILKFKRQELSEYLTSHKLTPEYMEKLADYMSEIAEHAMSTDKIYAMKVFEQILELYTIVDSSSNSHSFNRISKKEKIKAVLSAL